MNDAGPHTKLVDPVLPKRPNVKTLWVQSRSASSPAERIARAYLLALKSLYEQSELTLTKGFSVLAVHQHTGRTAGIHVDNPGRGGVAPVVFGRHECAKLHLPVDPGLSLRHGLLLLSRDQSGAPCVRVLDLGSEQGLLDVREKSHWSIATDGSLALAVADSVLFVFPDEEVAGLPRAFEQSTWPELSPWEPVTAPEKQLAAKRRITGETSAVSLSCLSPEEMRAQRPKDRVARLVIKLSKEERSFDIDRAELLTGTLFGRYPRCRLGGDRVPLDDTISRVHLVFVEIDGRPYAIDTASTNGTLFGDMPIDLLPLMPGQPTRLDLGSCSLTWWPV